MTAPKMSLTRVIAIIVYGIFLRPPRGLPGPEACGEHLRRDPKDLEAWILGHRTKEAQ